MQDFHYRIPWRARGQVPGHHRSLTAGGGLDFRGHAPLIDARDPRRVDIRASLADPWQRWLTRTYSQRSAVRVWLVADLSASMGFAGAREKPAILADFAESLAYSAQRTGDAFGFIGCGERVEPDWVLPASFAAGAGLALAGRLRAHRPQARSAAGLLHAAAWLGSQRGVVFLVSDFHFPEDFLARLLESLARHQVTPLVLWDESECRRLPRFGVTTLTDPESGARRFLLLRPSLATRLREAFAQRRARLGERFAAAGLRPLFVTAGFEAAAVTRHFFGAEPDAT